MNYFQQSLFKNLLMTITENHYENIGRRHTKAIESFNIFNTPKKICWKPYWRTKHVNIGRRHTNKPKQQWVWIIFLKNIGKDTKDTQTWWKTPIKKTWLSGPPWGPRRARATYFWSTFQKWHLEGRSCFIYWYRAQKIGSTKSAYFAYFVFYISK